MLTHEPMKMGFAIRAYELLAIRYRREPSLSPCGARLSLDDSYHY